MGGRVADWRTGMRCERGGNVDRTLLLTRDAGC
jgi:hypothetical protein